MNRFNHRRTAGAVKKLRSKPAFSRTKKENAEPTKEKIVIYTFDEQYNYNKSIGIVVASAIGILTLLFLLLHAV